VVIRQMSQDDFSEIKDPRLPRGYLSSSQISKYLLCPNDYRLTYVEGRSWTGNEKTVLGSVVHKLIEVGLTLYKNTGRIPSIEEVLDLSSGIVNEEYSNASEAESFLPEKGVDFIVDMSQKSYTTWYKVRMPQIVPLAIEKEVLGTINNIPIRGYIDYIDGSGEGPTVVDLKVGAKKRETSTSIQLGLYGLLEGIDRVAYDTILQPTKTLPHRHVFSRTTYGEKYKEHIARIISGVYKGITSGFFPHCLPDNWNCQSKFCSNYQECRG